MNRPAKLPSQKQSGRAAANRSRLGAASTMAANAPGSVAQRELLDSVRRSPRVVSQRRQFLDSFGGAVQARDAGRPAARATGLPDPLRSGMESLAGISLENVQVHYNSSSPAQLGALAYAQGSSIHVAPGQERHLPHEAWHVVQQAQGRVHPTTLVGGTPVNDEPRLEREADVMGAKATAHIAQAPSIVAPPKSGSGDVVSRVVDPGFASQLPAGASFAERKNEIETFYQQYVQPEMERIDRLPIEEALLENARSLNRQFGLFLLNSRSAEDLERKLAELIAAINAAADSHDQAIVDAAATRVALNPYAAPAVVAENALRDERRKRQGSRTRAGRTQERAVRGVRSSQEAFTLLGMLQAALNGVLGNDFGRVGIRGSAVTGIRSRNEKPFEEGLEQNQSASDASDLDFFFTHGALSDEILPGETNAGVMNTVDLGRWLGAHEAEFPGLRTALTNFSQQAKQIVGRKCDVVLIGPPTADTLLGDAGTLIL